MTSALRGRSFFWKISACFRKNNNEPFTLTAPPNIEPEVYRLQYSQSSLYDYVEVIINGKKKEIAFDLDLGLPERPITFSASEKNKKWVVYKQRAKHPITKYRNTKSADNQL